VCSSDLGVLIDDLVTKGTQEPYRMFTSRAEYRLMLRHDNADARLTEKGHQIGLISHERYKDFEEKRETIEREKTRLKKTRVSSPELQDKQFGEIRAAEILPETTLSQLLQRPEMDYETIAGTAPPEKPLAKEIKQAVEIEIKYAGYIKQQIQLIEKYKNMEGKQIPPNFDYTSLSGLSREVTEKLLSVRPLSLGQASRIPGITPAAIFILAIALAKRAREGRV
jgi:tRNA uridine 5-carboxymethylaminomethyl modification enzyme